MTFIVLCRASVHEGGDGRFEQATRQTFADRAAAQEYAAGISPSREPTVVRLGPAPTCQNCKHWQRVVATEPHGFGTGLPLAPYDWENPAKRSEHGHCTRAVQHKDLRYEEVATAPVVACDSEDYGAWLATLPTFGCVKYKERSDG